jgi:hypothetical protein
MLRRMKLCVPQISEGGSIKKQTCNYLCNVNLYVLCWMLMLFCVHTCMHMCTLLHNRVMDYDESRIQISPHKFAFYDYFSDLNLNLNGSVC